MRSTNFAIVSVNKVGVLSARLVCYLNQLSRRPVVANSKEGLGKAKIYAAATAAGRYGAPARCPHSDWASFSDVSFHLTAIILHRKFARISSIKFMIREKQEELATVKMKRS